MVAIPTQMEIHDVVVTAKACLNIPIITGESFLDIKANIPKMSEGNEEMARDNATQNPFFMTNSDDLWYVTKINNVCDVTRSHFSGIFLQLFL